MKTLLAILSTCAAVLPAMAQHSAQHPPGGHGAASASAYAGQETREIKALSDQERAGWLDGQGMGLARAAELNGYPGPMHVLELADRLRLTPEQAVATRELMHRHKTEVRALGARLVDAERELDTAFRERRATRDEVERMTARIGGLQARIRAAHLETHLAQSTLLTPEQIDRYAVLRGYR